MTIIKEVITYVRPFQALKWPNKSAVPPNPVYISYGPSGVPFRPFKMPNELLGNNSLGMISIPKRSNIPEYDSAVSKMSNLYPYNNSRTVVLMNRCWLCFSKNRLTERYEKCERMLKPENNGTLSSALANNVLKAYIGKQKNDGDIRKTMKYNHLQHKEHSQQ